MARNRHKTGQKGDVSAKGRGRNTAPDQPVIPPEPPLAKRVETVKSKSEFLSRDLNGKPRRTTAAARGRQGRKTTRGGLEKSGTRVKLRNFQGPRGADRFIYSDAIKNLARTPLTDCARELYKQYRRYSMFWEEVEHRGHPVEEAGWLWLDVKKSQAHAIHRAVAAAGCPRRWFRCRVAAEMNAGRIGRGRATLHGREADAFYAALAGGEKEAEGLETREYYGVTVGQVNGHYESVAGNSLEREILEYQVCRYIATNGRKDPKHD